MSLSKFFVLFFSIVTLFCVTSNSFGQAFMWEFGVEGGAGIRSLRFDPKDSLFKTGVSYTGGIFGAYNFDKTWSLKLGAAYEKKGGDFEYTLLTDAASTVKGHQDVDYVSIPLLVKAQFGNGKKVKFFINAGPYLGILLGNKIKVTEPTASETDIKDSTKSTDFGISGGLGVDFLVGTNMSFRVEARDNYGLSDINDSKSTPKVTAKTNTANLMLGFCWKFGKKATKK